MIYLVSIETYHTVGAIMIYLVTIEPYQTGSDHDVSCYHRNKPH